jgi:flagellar hook protein FlgE
MTEKSGGFYIPTPDSGNLHVGTSGSSGLGVITPRALEESTTDIATELANAIKTQYVYSANAKTIATVSEMLETLLKV